MVETTATSLSIAWKSGRRIGPPPKEVCILAVIPKSLRHYYQRVFLIKCFQDICTSIVHDNQQTEYTVHRAAGAGLEEMPACGIHFRSPGTFQVDGIGPLLL